MQQTGSRVKLWPFYSDEIRARLDECLAHGDLGSVDGHPAIEEFERAFAALLVSGRGVAFFNSGTSAFCAGLYALDLPAGSEVIVPRRTFRATVTPLYHFGLRPVFANCDAVDGCISPEAVERTISTRTRAIVVTHQWGQPARLPELRAIADAHKLTLIEDCSHAHGVTFDGKPLGTWGDLAFFSCGTTKLVSGGTGGVFTTGSDRLYQRALVFGQPKRRCLLEITDPHLRRLADSGVGVNLRGNPFSAVLALDHLSRLEAIVAGRKKNLSELDEIVAEMCPWMNPIAQRPGSSGTWYKRPFRVSHENATLIESGAKYFGIDIGWQDRPLDVELAPMAANKGIEVRTDPAPEHGVPILLLPARELYSDCWDRSKYVTALRRMNAAIEQ